MIVHVAVYCPYGLDGQEASVVRVFRHLVDAVKWMDQDPEHHDVETYEIDEFYETKNGS